MTRKQLVLQYLQAHPNEWVGGMELFNAQVGGTRGGGRIFDLREDGYIIESRPSKRAACWEYKLVDERQLAMGLVA